MSRSNDMSIVEYYHALVQLDWYSSWSDDPQTYWAGEVGYEVLHEVALNNGPPFAWLMAEYKKRLFSGKPWGSEPLPMLTVPDAPTMDVMIDLRADYECLAFSPVAGTSVKSILDRAFNMGALTCSDSKVPHLLKGVPLLSEAWDKGQREAVDLFKALRPAGLMVKLLAAQKASHMRAVGVTVTPIE